MLGTAKLVTQAAWGGSATTAHFEATAVFAPRASLPFAGRLESDETLQINFNQNNFGDSALSNLEYEMAGLTDETGYSSRNFVYTHIFRLKSPASDPNMNSTGSWSIGGGDMDFNGFYHKAVWRSDNGGEWAMNGGMSNSVDTPYWNADEFENVWLQFFAISTDDPNIFNDEWTNDNGWFGTPPNYNRFAVYRLDTGERIVKYDFGDSANRPDYSTIPNGTILYRNPPSGAAEFSIGNAGSEDQKFSAGHSLWLGHAWDPTIRELGYTPATVNGKQATLLGWLREIETVDAGNGDVVVYVKQNAGDRSSEDNNRIFSLTSGKVSQATFDQFYDTTDKPKGIML
jgi:hypothetical protein